jgi:hypothetical protein
MNARTPGLQRLGRILAKHPGVRESALFCHKLKQDRAAGSHNLGHGAHFCLSIRTAWIWIFLDVRSISRSGFLFSSIQWLGATISTGDQERCRGDALQSQQTASKVDVTEIHTELR